MATKIVNGVVVDMTAQDAAEFEAARAPALPQAKREARERIAERRARAETGGFAHLTVRYDSRGPDLARLAILGARARAAKAAAQPFTVRMAAADESESAMNADELIALELSAGDHFVACSARARTLRQAVNTAVDVPAVLAVDIDIGWP